MKTPFLLLNLALILGVVGACRHGSQTAPVTETAELPLEPSADVPACCQDVLPTNAPLDDQSIYQLESNWTTADGETNRLASLRGQKQVVSMGYTTCAYACPQLLADMKQIESGLSPALREQVGFTFISIDPGRDTPERLREYRRENELNPARWTLLTGFADDVLELAVVLGIQFRKTTDTDFAHSNMITILDEGGLVLHRQEGLAVEPGKAIQVLSATGEASP